MAAAGRPIRESPSTMQLRLWLRALIIASALAATSPAAAAGDVWPEVPHDAGARSEGRPGLKYAPDRPVDVLHVRIEVAPDFETRTIDARATVRFTPRAATVDRLVLDAVDLSIGRVSGEPRVTDFHVSAETLEINFEREIRAGETASVTIDYRAEPRRGLYFRTPAQGYAEGEEQIWTQGETHESRHWFPGVDYPSERFTSEVVCRVPEGMIARSNGRLLSRQAGEDGLVAWHWVQDKAHPGYLVALVAGQLSGVEDSHRDLPLAFWTAPSKAGLIGGPLEETKRMLDFFEQEIGVPYPWAKYEQAAVLDFLYGGMENTTLTVLNDRSLRPPEYGRLEESTGLIAHELAHQWFGDYVTCKDWSHAWLNEGFATYYTALYREHSEGAAVMRYRLWDAARALVENAEDTRPIVARDYEVGFDQFSHRAYTKGAWVLHMLRGEVGEGRFREGVRLYLDRHALGSVVTEDLVRAMEEVSGRSLDRFFDQWVFHGGVPALEVTYQWHGPSKQARISVRQIQKVTDDALLFDVPLAIRFSSEGWIRDETVRIGDAGEEFIFYLERPPASVQIDPESDLLARIDFSPGRGMLLGQLRDPGDGLGRARAANALGGTKDAETVAALARTLEGDAFYGARIEAARSLHRIGTRAATEALIAGAKQEDERVRFVVIQALASKFDAGARTLLIEVTKHEANPVIAAEAIGGLGRYPDESLNDLFRDRLQTDSFQQQISLATMRALRRRDATGMTDAIRARLAERRLEFSSDGIAEALEIIGFLGRARRDKAGLRDELLGELASPVSVVRIGALKGLGELGEVGALAAVEGFTGEDQEEPVRKAARAAAEKLQLGRPAESQLRELRQDVLDLKASTGELRDEVESLEKRLEAADEARPDGRRERRYFGLF